MSAENDPAIDWEEFVNRALLQYQLPYFEVSYPSLDPITQSAVTAINEALLDQAVATGHPGIAIGICDYSREALAFSFARATRHVLEAEPFWNFKTRFPDKGQRVALGSAIVEYHGVDERNDGFGNRIGFKPKSSNKNNKDLTKWLPLAKLPTPQPCASGATLTTLRQANPTDAGREYSILPDLAKKLIDHATDVNSSVVIASSSSPLLNIPPTMLDRADLSFGSELDTPLSEYLCTGRFSAGSLKTRYKYPVEATKCLIATSRTSEGFADLFDVIEYLDEGGKVNTLVVEAPTAECLDNIRGGLSEIISDYKIPVIVFCEEGALRRTDTLAALQIPLFIWSESQLRNLANLTNSQKLKLTRRQDCFIRSTKRVKVVQDSGQLSQVAKPLYSLSSARERLSEREQSALISLLSILGQAMKRSEVLISKESQTYWERIDAAVESLTSSGFSLTEAEVAELTSAAAILKSLCRPEYALPKEEAMFDAIRHSIEDLGRSVCLIVPKGTSEIAASEYWAGVLEDEELSIDKIRVVTPRAFLRQDCTLDDEEVFVSGWFGREEMERILNSGLSDTYMTFLYKGVDDVDLENKWYKTAEEYWQKHHEHQMANARRSLSKLGISPSIWVQEHPEQASREEDDSLPGIVRSITKKYSQSQATTSESGALGRPIWFTNGTRRWLKTGEAGGDTLLVVTDALDSDAEYDFARKTANAIQEGDVVLRTESDDAALDVACQVFGGYAKALSVAREWYEPIARAKTTMGKSALIKKIIEAGCERNKLTISHWIDDPTTIAPSDTKDIMCIGKALGHSFTQEQLARITQAASAVRGNRISGGRKIAKDIAAAFADTACQLGSLEKAAAVFAEKHSDMGEIELLYVDYVGDPAIVPLSKFGWYMG